MATAQECRECVATGDNVWCLGGSFGETDTNCEEGSCSLGDDLLVQLVSECNQLELSYAISVLVGIAMASVHVMALSVVPVNEKMCKGFEAGAQICIFFIYLATFAVLIISLNSQGHRNAPNAIEFGIFRGYLAVSCALLTCVVLGKLQQAWKWSRIAALYMCALALALDIVATIVIMEVTSADPLDVGPYLKTFTHLMEFVIGCMICWVLPSTLAIIIAFVISCVYSQGSDEAAETLNRVMRARMPSRQGMASGGNAIEGDRRGQGKDHNTKDQVHRPRERDDSRDGSLKDSASETVEVGIPVAIPTATTISEKVDSKD